MTALSRLTVGDDWVAFAALVDGRRHNQVVDLADGTVLWSKPASRSGVLSGLGPVPPPVIDDHLIHLTGTPTSEWVRIEAVDVRTGATRWSTDQQLWFSRMPGKCDDSPNVCATAFLDDRDGRHAIELSIETGELVRAVPGAEPLRDGLGLQRDDGREDLVRHTDDGGDELWSVRLDEVFEYDVNPGFGWSIELDESSGIVVAYVGDRDDDYGNATVIGLDYATGERRWIRPGRTLQCIERIDLDDVDVWCAESGTLIIEWEDDNTGQIVERSDVTSRIEVFDPATGEPLGGVDVATYTGWDGSGEFVPPPNHLWNLVDELAVRAADDGLATIDVTTGESDPIDDAAVAWCEDEREVELPPGIDERAFVGFTSCEVGDDERTPVGGVIPSTVLPEAGERVGDIVVYVTAGRVTAVRVIS